MLSLLFLSKPNPNLAYIVHLSYHFSISRNYSGHQIFNIYFGICDCCFLPRFCHLSTQLRLRILGQFPGNIKLITTAPLRPIFLDRKKVPMKGWIGPNDVKISISLDRTSTDIPDNGASRTELPRIFQTIELLLNKFQLSIAQK